MECSKVSWFPRCCMTAELSSCQPCCRLLAYASHCSEAGAALVSPGQTAVSTEQAQHRASNQQTKKHEIIVFTFCFYSESQARSWRVWVPGSAPVSSQYNSAQFSIGWRGILLRAGLQGYGGRDAGCRGRGEHAQTAADAHP